jgi:hypothetical protein
MTGMSGAKRRSCGCFITGFGAVVGLGFSLFQGVNGAKLAGLGAYLFVWLGIGVFAARRANPANATFPCCPEAEWMCAGITITVEELAPAAVQSSAAGTVAVIMASSGNEQRSTMH